MRKLTFATLVCTLVLTACNETDVHSTRTPKGNPNAAVIVEEFADLQCPACNAAHTAITQPIIEKYGEQIRFEFRHFPIRSIHRYALDAAEMSECAADQGKFWEFVDLAYEKQADLDEDALLEWVEEIGLNAEEAERCWKSHQKRDIVLSEYSAGRDMGVAGTPTYFVNGTKVENGFDTLSDAIDAELEGTMMRL